MTGGKIVDFYLSITDDKKFFNVEFLVRDKFDYCCVTAKTTIPVYENLCFADSIWWQGDFVMIKIFGCSDVQFPKIGNSGGDAKSFYKRMFEVHHRKV